MLSGKPDAAEKVDVTVNVTIDQEVRKLNNSRLGWGVEQVASTSTERVGSATRRYSIEIGRSQVESPPGRFARLDDQLATCYINCVQRFKGAEGYGRAAWFAYL